MTTLLDQDQIQAETPKERAKRHRAFINDMVDKIYAFTLFFTDFKLHPYQEVFAKRLIRAVISNEGAELTGLWSRQSGKTEVIADVVVGLMVILPKLAPMFPDLGGTMPNDPTRSKYIRGMQVGTFAPTEDQANTLFSRIKGRLTSRHATELMSDPEIDDGIRPGTEGGRYLELKNGSSVRMQTANPKAKIESKTYHLIIIDEAQGADEFVIKKSIYPMGSSVNATRVMIGTPDVVKGFFYSAIRRNKAKDTERKQQSHFEYDWKVCAKYNADYKKYIEGEVERIGEDSDEFKLSYLLIWLLERGMFVPDELADTLAMKDMDVVDEWTWTPCVAGIDIARKTDSTVVTVVWVDWDRPDEFGYYEHRILDWYEIHGDRWEEQYFQVVTFLNKYKIFAVAVDGQGIGDVFAERLGLLMPGIDVHAPGSSNKDQGERWSHLMALLQRKRPDGTPMLAWPGSKAAKKLRRWKRFDRQMRDLQKEYKGPYLLAEAPNEAEAHDDYPDSLALAVGLTREFVMPEVQVSESPFVSNRRAARR